MNNVVYIVVKLFVLLCSEPATDNSLMLIIQTLTGAYAGSFKGGFQQEGVSVACVQITAIFIIKVYIHANIKRAQII